MVPEETVQSGIRCMTNLFEIKLQEIFKQKLKFIELVSDGVNKNYKVTIDSDNFFIRLSPESLHNYDEIQTEINILKTAEAAGVPCCKCISVNGNEIIGPMLISDRKYYGFCNSLIAGRALEANAGDIYLFGKSLGLLHSVKVTREGTMPPPANVFRSGDVIFEDKYVTEFARIARELDNRFEPNKHKALSDKLPDEFGLCHGDAWIGNGILQEGTVHLFDFEHSFFGSTVFDISTVVWSLLDFDESKQYELFSAFSAGYRSQCKKRYHADHLHSNIIFNEIRRLLFFIYFVKCGDNTVADSLIQSAQRLLHMSGDSFLNLVKKSKLFKES